MKLCSGWTKSSCITHTFTINMKCGNAFGLQESRADAVHVWLAVDVDVTCSECLKSQPFKHFLIFSPALVTAPAAHICPPLPAFFSWRLPLAWWAGNIFNLGNVHVVIAARKSYSVLNGWGEKLSKVHSIDLFVIYVPFGMYSV